MATKLVGKCPMCGQKITHRRKTPGEVERLKKLAEASRKPRKKAIEKRRIVHEFVSNMAVNDSISVYAVTRKLLVSDQIVRGIFESLATDGVLAKEGNPATGFRWRKLIPYAAADSQGHQSQ